jgi:Uma2 family endonuclease
MTFEQWAQQLEDETGELVDGHLTEEEVPDPAHELTVSWLIVLFSNWLRGKGGFVFGSEIKLCVTPKRGRKADVVVCMPSARPPPRRGLLKEPPDILVEVVTPTPRDERRDRVEKMSEYAEFGVPYYWIVDPALGSLEIFQLTDDHKYKKARGVTSGRIDDVPGCAALRLDLDELWRELDRLASESDNPI